MKKLLYIIAAGVLAGGAVSCTKDVNTVTTDEQGTLKLSFNVQSKQTTRTEAEELLSRSILRVYEGTEKLIRKYEPASEMPEEGLMLMTGTYRAAVEVGTPVAASFDEGDKYYYGEKEFEILPRQTVDETILCAIRNVGVTVKLGSSIAECIDGFNVHVAAGSDGLDYTETKTGFFLPADENRDIEWAFSGTTKSGLGNIEGGIAVDQSGIIAAPEAGENYTLTFEYSETRPGVMGVVVTVDKSEEEHQDGFYFSPQPSVKGEGVSSVLEYTGGDLTLDVAFVQPLTSIVVTIDGNEFEILSAPTRSFSNALRGVTYEPTSDITGRIAIDESFVADYEEGTHTLQFTLTDESGSVGKTRMQIAVDTENVSAEVEDLWRGTGYFARAAAADATEIAMRYRNRSIQAGMVENEFGEWKTIPAAREDTYRCVAQVADLAADHEYEYQLVVDGVPQSNARRMTTAVGTQIPNGKMEQWENNGNIWYPCVGRGSNQGSGYTGFWATGNGKVSIQEVIFTKPDNNGHSGRGAYMETLNIWGNIAAGNLFTGYFDGAETSGRAKVYLGRPFEYNARPKKLRFWYKADIGGGDKGRVFVMLCNMTKPHFLDNKNEGSIVDPTWKNVSDGHSYGYADQYFTSSVGEWTQIEMEIEYHDEYLDAGAPNYLIISTTSSWDGAHTNGREGNKLWLDDIEFVY